MITEAALVSALSRYWGLGSAHVAVHNGGIGSQTWFVELDDRRWVAKAVAPHAGTTFAGGMAIARRLDEAGIPAGPPVPATDGKLVVDAGGGWLALLTWVPGHPLTGRDDAEQAVMGATLARVHRALLGYEVADAERFHWVDPDADYLSLRPWLRPAIVAALDVLEAARPDAMSWGLLHTDPAADAFRLDPVTGRCGVIDWAYAVCGPLIYDLASAAMYVGGLDRARPLIAAYLDGGVVGADEVRDGLAPMLRFRWAVQANYFAWRIAGNDLTGISDPADNEKGLEDARQALTSEI